MDEDSKNQNLQKEIAALRRELESSRDLLDSKNRTRDAGTLIEKVILRYFVSPDRKPKGLGGILATRKRFLRKKRIRFSDVDFAIKVRNGVTHDTDFKPTEQQQERASKLLLDIIALHIKVLEKRSSRESTSQSESHVPTTGSDTTGTNVPNSGATLAETEEPAAPAPVEAASDSESAAPQTRATKIEPEPPPPLDAADDDPEVTASTLAEYTFCPRAGILTHEGGYSDKEDELPSQALLPWYEQEAIEEAYTHALYVLFALPVGLVAVILILSLMLLGHFLYPFLLIGVLVGWLRLALWANLHWRKVGKRRLAFQLATECNPVPGKNAFQPVDWWGLLLAGYEVERPTAALHHERWKLGGKPRRILRKGTMSIPVHRINNPDGPILPQHIVRVMVHCHLIETTEGANSPFAVVLFGNTYQGMTVPYTPKNRDLFYKALKRVRTAIIESDAREREPPEPVTGNICSACHFGRPRPVSREEKTMRYGEPLNPFLLHNGKKVVHCDCGDRFHWKPKHDANRKLRRLE